MTADIPFMSTRKPNVDSDEAAGGEEVPDTKTLPMDLKRSFLPGLPRGLRKAVFRSRGDLEEGTEMDDLR